MCKGELKGFMNEFNFYKPLEDNRSTHDCIVILNFSLYELISGDKDS